MKPENKHVDTLLFEKGKRGALRMLFGRTGVFILLLLLQIWVLFSVLRFLETLIPYVFVSLAVFTVMMVIHVINTQDNESIKMTWIILITLLPGYGSMIYLFIRSDLGHRKIKKRLQSITAESEKDFTPQDQLMQRLRAKNRGLHNLGTYMQKVGGFPIYEKSRTRYFPLGEDAFAEMLLQLKKAESFIFLEYFILAEGVMWGQILRILVEKVQQGVEVRLMYDGTCEFALLPHSYPKKLQQLGITAKVFAPLRPFLSTHYNYRDHRKIMVIDGRVAFTGGINISDEYINEKEVYGHWKDTAVMVEGDAVASFTLMFLRMWNMNETDRTYLTDAYRANTANPMITGESTAGYVLPFGDYPLDDDQTGKTVYMDILDRAEDYVYIMTPYLVLDSEIMMSLQFAAKRGVDVKIILPHIPDKKLVFAQSRSHYTVLIQAGVGIYEYTPGFMHAKVFLSDNKKAVVGTINLDYRSLYHHFENAVYFEGTQTIADIEEDFRKTLEQSQKVTPADIKKYNIFMTLMGRVLKIIAPMV